MKKLPVITLVLAISGPASNWSVQGEDVKPPQAVESRSEVSGSNRERTGRLLSARPGPLERASKVLGADLKDAAGEKVGKVRELAVDMESARVLAVVVAAGGVLGVGEKLVLVPPSAITRDGSDDVVLGLDRERLKGAAEFTYDQWATETQPDRLASMRRYFAADQTGAAARRDHESVPAAVGLVERASKIIGLPVTNDAGEKVGKVDELLVDLRLARVAEVVIATGGFLGVGGELSGIPPSLLRFDVENGRLALQVTKETLQSAPRFKADEWSSHAAPEKVGEVYRAYGVQPYYESGVSADNSARNVRDRNDRTLTPLDQGDNEADVKTTAQIRRELMRKPGLSVNARNVKIITTQGRVTLRGPVGSAAEKEAIEEIAHRIAGVDRVSSEVEVLTAKPAKP